VAGFFKRSFTLFILSGNYVFSNPRFRFGPGGVPGFIYGAPLKRVGVATWIPKGLRSTFGPFGPKWAFCGGPLIWVFCPKIGPHSPFFTKIGGDPLGPWTGVTQLPGIWGFSHNTGWPKISPGTAQEF